MTLAYSLYCGGVSEALVEPAVAIQELLHGSERCLVQFLGAVHHVELPTKLAVKRFCIIAHHFKPAAFGGALWTKCTDNHVATSLDQAGNLPNVGKTSLRCREEMEYRSVMPEVVGILFQPDFDDITDQPTHLLGSRTQSLFCHFDCCLRDIEHGEVFVSTKKQVVN